MERNNQTNRKHLIDNYDPENEIAINAERTTNFIRAGDEEALGWMLPGGVRANTGSKMADKVADGAMSKFTKGYVDDTQARAESWLMPLQKWLEKVFKGGEK